MWKSASLIHLLVVVLGYMLVPSIWGFTNGILLSWQLGSDPAFLKEISATLGITEFKGWQNSSLENLPEEKRIAVQAIAEKHLQKMAWLPSHVVSNFVTFAILGLVLGIFGIQRYCFIVPVFLLPATLKFVDAPFIVKSWSITLGLVLVIQVSSVHGFAMIGNWIKRPRKPAP